LQSALIEGLPRLLLQVAPAVVISPPINSLQGLAQSTITVLPSSLITVPVADIVSQVITQGKLQIY